MLGAVVPHSWEVSLEFKVRSFLGAVGNQLLKVGLRRRAEACGEGHSRIVAVPCCYEPFEQLSRSREPPVECHRGIRRCGSSDRVGGLADKSHYQYVTSSSGSLTRQSAPWQLSNDCFYEDSSVKPFFHHGIDGWDFMGPSRRHELRMKLAAWSDSERPDRAYGRGPYPATRSGEDL